MGDWGIRISQTGDVKTASDLDCAITSKYSNLKGAIAGTGSKSVAEGTTQTVTIAHGLAYIPAVRVLSDMAGEIAASTYYDSPLFFSDGFGYLVSAFARADATNVYLDFSYYNYGVGGSITYNYKYFIFLDKAKLT